MMLGVVRAIARPLIKHAGCGVSAARYRNQKDEARPFFFGGRRRATAVMLCTCICVRERARSCPELLACVCITTCKYKCI